MLFLDTKFPYVIGWEKLFASATCPFSRDRRYFRILDGIDCKKKQTLPARYPQAWPRCPMLAHARLVFIEVLMLMWKLCAWLSSLYYFWIIHFDSGRPLATLLHLYIFWTRPDCFRFLFVLLFVSVYYYVMFLVCLYFCWLPICLYCDVLLICVMHCTPIINPVIINEKFTPTKTMYDQLLEVYTKSLYTHQKLRGRLLEGTQSM